LFGISLITYTNDLTPRTYVCVERYKWPSAYSIRLITEIKIEAINNLNKLSNNEKTI